MLESLSFDLMEVELALEVEPERESWMTSIKNFLKNGTLPLKKSERRVVDVRPQDTFYRTTSFIVKGFQCPYYGVSHTTTLSMYCKRCMKVSVEITLGAKP